VITVIFKYLYYALRLFGGIMEDWEELSDLEDEDDEEEEF